MALFGNGSFLANRIAYPMAYFSPNTTLDPSTQQYYPPNVGSCLEMTPFVGLTSDTSGHADAYGPSTCIKISDGGVDGVSLSNYMATWYVLFPLYFKEFQDSGS